MTFFNPTGPIGLHLERLPDTAIATCAHYNQQSGKTTLTVWAPGLNELRCTYSEENTYDSFFENTCENCDFYTDALNIDVDDVEVYSSTYGDVTLYGSATAHSPSLATTKALVLYRFHALLDIANLLQTVLTMFRCRLST